MASHESLLLPSDLFWEDLQRFSESFVLSGAKLFELLILLVWI